MTAGLALQRKLQQSLTFLTPSKATLKNFKGAKLKMSHNLIITGEKG